MDDWRCVERCAGGAKSGRATHHPFKTGRGTEQLLQPYPEELAGHLIFDNLPMAFDAIFAMGNAEAF